MKGSFKCQFKEKLRLKEAEKAMMKYPTRLPVIVEGNSKSIDEKIKKRKYLVPVDLTMGQFHYILRKRMKISPEKAMYIFANGCLLPNSSLMSEIYSKHKDLDKFVYFLLDFENTFGMG